MDEKLELEVERLRKENTFLRAYSQKTGCPYSNTTESGACKSGYPGCACADDLMVFLDEHTRGFIDERNQALAQVEALKLRFEKGIDV